MKFAPNAPDILIKKNWYHFLTPRYWGLWIFIGVLRLIVLLPKEALLKIGKGIGDLMYWFLPKRRHITAVNLGLCFPHLSTKERQKLMKDNFRAGGIGIVELGLAWWASDKRLYKMMTSNISTDILSPIEEKGILLVVGHFTTMELGLRFFNLFIPTKIMYRPQNNLLFEWLMLKARKRYTKGFITRYDARGLLNSLKNGETVWYAPDQDYGRKGSVFAPFFNVPAASTSATSRFIKLTQAKIAMGSCLRDKSKLHYSVHLTKFLDNYPSEDAFEDATRINQQLEQIISQHPEQYIWAHLRFKTRPEGIS